MRRAVKYGWIALLSAALVGAVLGGAAWLLGSASGLRWLMDTVSSRTPVMISARQVEGRLLDRLSLQGLRISLAPFDVKIESLDYRWQPLLLLSGRWAVKELTLAGVQVQDNTPEGVPPDLAWPTISKTTGFTGGGIERLRVNSLTYRLLDGQPVRLNALSASVSLQQGVLSITDLAAELPEGRVTGSITAGFARPTLQMELKVTPAKPIAEMDGFSIRGGFLPGEGGEQLTGRFTAAGANGNVKRLELAGEAGMTRNAFHFRQLRLTRPDRRGSFTGAGSVTLTAQAPLLEFQLAGEGIDLSSGSDVPTDLSGTLTLKGTLARYRGAFKLANRGKGWQNARLSGAYAGDGGGVKLAPLAGSFLDGSVQGNLDIDWGEELTLKGTVSVRNLNPAVVSADWAGVVHFDLAAGIAWPAEGPPRGEVSGRLLSSRLHGRELNGEVRADFSRNGLRIGGLALRGKGFDISAEGILGERLALKAQVADLGGLVPRAAGKLRADGWIRWRDHLLVGDVAIHGANISVAGLQVASADLTARIGEGEGNPLHATVKLLKAAHGRFRADSVSAEAEGTLLRHTVHLRLDAAEAEARALLAGSYDRGDWRGEVVRFAGRDTIGPWRLEAPAALSVAAGRVTLAPLVLKGVASERLEIAGDLHMEPRRGSFRAVWGGLSLVRANPWLPRELRIDGRLAGSVAAAINPGERLDLKGQASLVQGRVRWRDTDRAFEVDIPTAGWSLGWQGGVPGSAAETGAGKLVVAGRMAFLGSLTMDGRKIAVENGSLTLDGDERGLRAGAALALTGGGAVKGSFASAAPARLAPPETGDLTVEWSGIDRLLFGPWLPEGLRVDGMVAGRVGGKILPGKRLDLAGKLSLAQGKIAWQKGGEAIDADLRTAELAWGWQGAMPATAAEVAAGRLVVTGRVGAAALLTVDGRTISVEQGSLNLDGNERGLGIRVDFALPDGGTLKGRFASSQAAALALPAEGEALLEWNHVDLMLFKPWLPRATTLEGRLAGRVTGTLFPGQKLAVQGKAELSGGKVRWVRPEGEIGLNARSASVSWDWQGEALRGALAIALAEQGGIQGSFQLPIPASLPAAVDPKGPLIASLTGKVLEKGILAALFPGLIQESRGEIDGDLRIAGSWGEPSITGNLRLAKGGAYLPTAGIHIRDLRIAMGLEKGLLRIDSFRAESGPGHIAGTAVVRMKGWQIDGYSGRLNGDRFQVVYLPELQILVTPDLAFEGTKERLAIRGAMLLPELLIFGPPTRSVVLASPDVILEGVPKPPEKSPSLAWDVQVRLTLGDRVLVKLEGIDAQFGGAIDLVFQELDNITSKGEIKVVKGRYSAYGVNLEIVRGRLFYAGGPIGHPTLDILALRTVGDVRAGVTAGGGLRAPLIKLYSEPGMPDVDILAYIVFGRPLGSSSNSEQASMMAQAAGVLLSRGQSVVLQEQIKDRLGLSTLELQSGAGSTAERMGYKEIPTAPSGVARAAQANDVSQTMLTVGKYLTPELYFSYGRSLFTGQNLFRLRYDLFKGWQIETQTGSESGVDLYYKIEFD